MVNKQDNNNMSHVGDRIIGTNNTQLQFSFETFNTTRLSIAVQSVGGNFAYQGVAVDVSENNSDWVNVDNFDLSTGNYRARRYPEGLSSGLANPLDFQYIRVTVPALGSGISAVVIYGGKP